MNCQTLELLQLGHASTRPLAEALPRGLFLN